MSPCLTALHFLLPGTLGTKRKRGWFFSFAISVTRTNERKGIFSSMQRDRKSKEIYEGRKCKVTGFLVMAASHSGPGAAPPPLDTAGNSGRGKLAGARGCSIPKYTSSGKGNYKPEETVRRQAPPPQVQGDVRLFETAARVRTAGTVVFSLVQTP